MPRLFSYVIWTDGGLAPNPFFGICTLNCCKPKIRRAAQEGDWVAGFVGSNHPAERGRLIYAMRITHKMTMNEYDAWTLRELPEKIPAPHSRDYRRRAGDSLYDFSGDEPRQRNGYHGQDDMDDNLGGDYTLLSDEFYYFGRSPIQMPEHLRPVIHKGRAHSSDNNDDYVEAFVEWIRGEYESGKIYAPPRDLEQSIERVEIDPNPRSRRR